MTSPSRNLAIVTGASQGIGRAIAARLAQDGWDLALVARRAEVLAEVSEAIGNQTTVRTYPCDVADMAAVEQTVEAVRGDFDRVDALVNNAGITRDALLVRMTPDQWRDVLRVNLDGAFHLLRQVGPLMMRARRGRVVNITSVVGVMGNAGQINYSASKAGMIGMTKSAARELAGRGVTVNAVAPGFIETDMTKDLPDTAVKQMEDQIPLRRLGHAQDVAALVSFLLSDDAAYITGQVVHCDGGMVMA